MRKEAERLGLMVGKKIKHIRRRVNGEDNDYISKGKVEGLYRGCEKFSVNRLSMIGFDG